MATIILNLFLILIEVFFWNRIIVSLIYFIPSVKRKKLWSTFLVSLLDAALLYVYSIDTLIRINSSESTVSKGATITCAILSGVIIVFMYIQTLISISPSIRIKSSRQRRFERAMVGGEVSYAVPLVITGVAFLGGLFSWIYYQINYTSSYKTTLIVSRVITIICATLFVFFLVKTIINAKLTKKEDSSNVITIKSQTISKEQKIIFILDIEGSHEFYKKETKGSVNLHDLLGRIADYYYVSSYGVLKMKGEEYKLYGLKTTSFDVDLYQDIKMDRFESDALEGLVPYLDKNNVKVFTLDDDNNPVNSFDA